jgi:hypothetical protein
MKMKHSQNLWDIAKAVPKRKFISMSAFIKIPENYQISNLIIYLNLLEKQDQVNSQIGRPKEIIKVRWKLMRWRLKNNMSQ